MNAIWERIFTGVVTIGLLVWIWGRSTKRADELEKRVSAVEQACTQSAQLHGELLRMFEASATARKENHEEGQRALRELREDIGENEKRRHDTEHAILDQVNSIVLKAAEIAAVEKYKRENPPRLAPP